MKQSDVISALAALAQESRLAIFRLLVRRGPEGYAAGEISERLKIPGPGLSFHLKEMAHAGLVSPRKEGRYVIYAANFQRMNAVMAYLSANCCSQGTLCAPAPARAPSAVRRKAA